MKKLNRVIPILIGILFAVLLTGHLMAEEKEEENVGLEIGNVAPDFELETLEGDKVKLSDLRGKPVMLNFWATWCPPCRVEMPDMQKFHEENEVAVLAVNLFDTEMNKENVRKFVDEFGLTFQIGMDGDGEVAAKYRINPIPTTYMIDSEGVIQHIAFGAMEYETMVEHLNKMK
ncbi:TlpA disulfide reductase family protein [Oceanobacillus salinisoli]|uniref:TlpA disulfide reductase family protein n=1 Tax=Oceanobacillus salinisoli TaxID=2678611 RepID=UPI0012E0D911|nr:TlpA family protein disulfide reductase [Oceanobacillus salinisoli]